MAESPRRSVQELQQELQLLESSLAECERELEEKRQKSRTLGADLAEAQLSTASQEASHAGVDDEFRSAARVKQALQNGRPRKDDTAPLSRDEYIEQIRAYETEHKSVMADMEALSSRIKTIKEKKVDAQKRLTVIRLVSMLDNLQKLLQKKVRRPSGAEETRAQELLKTIQELSRERERTFYLLSRKEREMAAVIDLKQRRITELQNEFARNVNTYADANDKEMYTVMQRIQMERNQLLQEVERLEEANARMSEVLTETKYTTESAVKDRDTALSASVMMSFSSNPEKEILELREKIQKSNAERRTYLLKAEEVQNGIDEDTAKYDARMSKFRKEIIFYQNEAAQFEKEVKELQSRCDELAASSAC